MGEPNIAELAVAAWRLERWLDNLNAERKMAAKKSLREIRKYLDESGVETVDPLGWRFDPGLAVEVVNNEAEDVAEEELIVIQTNSPVVKLDGAVIQYGKVILGQNIKEQKANNEVKSVATDIQNEKVASVTECDALLSQGPVYIGNYGGYPCWVRQFDCKAVKEGYQAVIGVFSNVDMEVCLLDEKVYKEYQNGLAPMNPFMYRPKAGAAYIAPPYPDVWYMIAWPPVGAGCVENRFDSNCEWKKRADEVRIQEKTSEEEQATGDTPTKTEFTESSESKAANTDSQDSVCQTKDVGQIQGDTDGISVIDRGTDEKRVPEMSDKAFERMKKKNLSSYNIRSAADRGLFEIHGKKKR